MPKYFFTHTRHSRIEREMTSIPLFGIKAYVDKKLIEPHFCNECLYKAISKEIKKTDKIDCSICPYTLERILAEDIDPLVAFETAKDKRFPSPKNIFLTQSHNKAYEKLKKQFSNAIITIPHKAVLYLLSYSKELSHRLKGRTVTKALIDILVTGLSVNDYTLLCLAKDTLWKTSYICIEDYINTEIIPTPILALAFCSRLIIAEKIKRL